jgi:hypothetical protein
MVMTDIYIASEDALSEAVVDRLVADENHGLNVSNRLPKKGKGYLQQKFSSLVKLAQHIPVILLVDLDSEKCPVKLISSWNKSGHIPNKMLFRVAVREVESWVLADRKGFSEFAKIPISKMPTDPESILDPKTALINLVSHYGSKDIKADIAPKANSTAKQGLLYNERLAGFVRDTWSPDEASRVSESLLRMRKNIHNLRISTK